MIRLPRMTTHRMILINSNKRHTRVRIIRSQNGSRIIRMLTRTILSIIRTRLLNIRLVSTLTAMLISRTSTTLIITTTTTSTSRLRRQNTLIRSLRKTIRRITNISNTKISLRRLLRITSTGSMNNAGRQTLNRSISTKLINILLNPLNDRQANVLSNLTVSKISRIRNNRDNLMLNVTLNLLHGLRNSRNRSNKINTTRTKLISNRTIMLGLMITSLNRTKLIGVSNSNTNTIILNSLNNGSNLLNTTRKRSSNRNILISMNQNNIRRLITNMTKTRSLHNLILRGMLNEVITTIKSTNTGPRSTLSTTLIYLIDRGLKSSILGLFLDDRHTSTFLLI